MKSLHLTNQKELDKNYSFTPKVQNFNISYNNNFNNNINQSSNKDKDKEIETLSIDYVPRHIALNEDYNQRQINLQNIRLNMMRQVKAKANLRHSSRSPNPEYVNYYSNFNNYYEKLHEDANILKDKKRILYESTSKEHSFQPYINSNIKINSTFEERNSKLLSIKKELANKIKDLEKVEGIGKKENKLTKEEKEQSNKYIIENLYLKDIEKIKERRTREEKANEDNLLKNLKKKHKIKFKKEKIMNFQDKLNISEEPMITEEIKSEEPKITQISQDVPETKINMQINQKTESDKVITMKDLGSRKESNTKLFSNIVIPVPEINENCKSPVSSALNSSRKSRNSTDKRSARKKSSKQGTPLKISSLDFNTLHKRYANSNEEENNGTFKQAHHSTNTFKSKALMNILKNRSSDRSDYKSIETRSGGNKSENNRSENKSDFKTLADTDHHI